MSSHADTIRTAFAYPRRGNIEPAEQALDALEAELALSRNLYDELFAQTEQLRTLDLSAYATPEQKNYLLRESNKLLAENQRLRDALTEIAQHDLQVDYADCELRTLARRALRALDGTPSAAQTLEETQTTRGTEASSDG